MDEITKQIQQLKVTNRHKYGDPPTFFNETSKGNLDDTIDYRKSTAPSVPPKPNKKSPNYAEQIISSGVDSSSSIASDGENKLPFLLRKPSTYGQSGKLSTKVTLDNPDVLEQQLEALEHHKKQLQRRGKLAPNPSTNYQATGIYDTQRSTASRNQNLQSHLTATNDATYVNIGGIGNGGEIAAGVNDDTVSTRSLICRDSSPLSKNNNNNHNTKIPSSNLSMAINNNINNNCNNNFYSNIMYDPKPIFGASGNYTEDTTEDLLPPSSPVSSSYSELRHATTEDIFRTNNSNLKSYQCNVDTTSINSPQSQPPPPIIDYAQLDMNYGNCSGNNQNSGSSDLYFDNKDNTFNSVAGGGFCSQDNKPYSLDYYVYDGLSQNSSTYESIYEPINPQPAAVHPSSQLTKVPNNVSGVGATVYKLNENLLNKNIDHANRCVPTVLTTMQDNDGTVLTPIASTNSASSSYLLPANNNNSNIEPKVDPLNDYLMQPLNHSGSDLESYGICFKCNERVVGENSGCTAMGQIYHIICFTCSQCQINLQGKPFYALDGKPYCEYDYLQTLEKCSVCMTPILERILRATGKPFHPQCFTCVVCKKSLDGIPFTVDAINQNYCIEDFHKKFAPRCCVCKGPIMPKAGEDETVRVVALDRSFHFECYKCEDCGLLLSSEADGCGCYPLDDHVLCKNCNAKRVQMLTDHMTAEL